VSKDSDQTETAPRKFKLGPLGSLNQVTKGLAKTIRAMADGTLDSQVGARICNGLGIMRACLETQKLEQLEARMDEIADRVARDRTNAASDRTNAAHEEYTHEDARSQLRTRNTPMKMRARIEAHAGCARDDRRGTDRGSS